MSKRSRTAAAVHSTLASVRCHRTGCVLRSSTRRRCLSHSSSLLPCWTPSPLHSLPSRRALSLLSTAQTQPATAPPAAVTPPAPAAHQPSLPSSPATPRGVFLVDDGSSSGSVSPSAPALWSVRLLAYDPPPPRPDEVRVRVHAVSVNPIDVMTRRGYGRSLLPLVTPFPRLLGRDGCGVVERVGFSMWHMKVGSRVWFSRDPAGPGSFAEELNVARRELSLAPRRLSLQSAAAFPFVWTTLWTALVDAAQIRPRSLTEMSRERMDRAASTSSASASSPAGPAALVHGAGGPLGRLAVRTLRAWGYTVTATLKQQQSARAIERSAHLIVRTGAEAVEGGADESSAWSSSSPPSWLSQLPARGCYGLFLDCVGGAASEAAAVQALQPGSGVFVTLRGELVSCTDELGVLRGGVQALQTLAARKAAFAARGLSYHWAINRCNSQALDYLAHAIDQHCILEEEYERTEDTGEDGDLHMQGIEQVEAALEQAEQRKRQGKLLIAIGTREEDPLAHTHPTCSH